MSAYPLVVRPLLDPLLERFVELRASDLYLTVGCPPSARISDRIIQISDRPMDDAVIERIIAEILTQEQRDEFQMRMEYNMSLPWNDSARFRINMFRQQQHSGLVVRRIQVDIPTSESLRLPQVYNDLIMEKRGLVLVVGPTGAGKSTSLAAMLGYRNRHGYGHIVTVEDPIEFVHKHDGCIITQRDIGIDTISIGMALKNVLRQRPDVVLIGEIRDQETMAHALHFAETGHLCVATLHAGNTVQAIESVFSFFPEEKQAQVHHDLAHNLRGILAQRLVLTMQGTRTIATEVMLNRGLLRSHIQDNKIKEMPELIAKNKGEGMHTMDEDLCRLYFENLISEETVLAEADNPTNVRLVLHQKNTARRLQRGDIPALADKQPDTF